MNDLNYVGGENHRESSSTSGEILNSPLGNATLVSAIADLQVESRKSDLLLSEKINALVTLIKDLDITGGLSPEVTAQIADLESKKHTHINLSVVNNLTQSMLDAITGLQPHIENTGIHVSSAEKAEWTSRVTSAQLTAAIANFANTIHSHAITDVVGLRAELDSLLINSKGDPGTPGVSPVISVIGTESIASSEDAVVILDNSNTANPKFTFKIPKGADGRGFNIDHRADFASERFDVGFNDMPDGWTFYAMDTGLFYFRNHDNGMDDKPATDPAGWSKFSLKGEDGWSPILGVHTISPTKKVLKVVDWTGGTGNKPRTDYPLYLYSNGFTDSEVAATNIYPLELPYNGLDKTTPGTALDAVQGRELDVKKADKSDTYTKAEVRDLDAVLKAEYDAQNTAQQTAINANSAEILTKLGKTEKAADSELLDGKEGDDYQLRVEKGQANGYAELNADTEVPHDNINELVYQSSGTVDNADIVKDNGNGTVNLESTGIAFFKNPEHKGKLYYGVIPAQTNLIPQDGKTNYVKARWTGSTLEYFMDLNQSDANASNVLIIGTVLRASTRLYITQWAGLANGKPDKINARIANTDKYRKELEGLVVSLTPGNELQMTAGVIYGVNKAFNLPIYSSTTPQSYDTYVYDAGGNWVSTAFGTVVPVGYYNARTGSPVQAAADKFTIGLIYRYIGTDKLYATVILDEHVFDNVADARNHAKETGLPDFTRDQHMYMGRIISKGDGSEIHIDRVTSISYDVAPVSAHGSLSGVLGNGQIHLSAVELNHMNDAYVHSQEPHAPADAYSKADADAITLALETADTDNLTAAKDYTDTEAEKLVKKILPTATDKQVVFETSTGLERSGMVGDTSSKTLDLFGYKLVSGAAPTHQGDVVTLPTSLAGQANKVMKVNAEGTALIMAAAGGEPVTNLSSTSDLLPLSASMGKKLNDDKVNKSDIIDSLTSSDPLLPLSGRQGKVLDEKKAEMNGDSTEDFMGKVIRAYEKIAATNEALNGLAIVVLPDRIYSGDSNAYKDMAINYDKSIIAKHNGYMVAKGYQFGGNYIESTEAYASILSAGNELVVGHNSGNDSIHINHRAPRVPFSAPLNFIFKAGSSSIYAVLHASDFVTASDIRLKKDIKNLEPTEEAKSIQAVEYVLRKDKNKVKQVGYVAQWVEKVRPQYVCVDEDGVKTVKYTAIHTEKIATLEAEVKELKEIIRKHIMNK